MTAKLSPDQRTKDAMQLVLKNRRGPMSPKRWAPIAEAEQVIAALILNVAASSGISMTARGWHYAMEPFGLSKGLFDRFGERLTDWRKRGLLPLGIQQSLIPSYSRLK